MNYSGDSIQSPAAVSQAVLPVKMEDMNRSRSPATAVVFFGGSAKINPHGEGGGDAIVELCMCSSFSDFYSTQNCTSDDEDRLASQRKHVSIDEKKKKLNATTRPLSPTPFERQVCSSRHKWCIGSKTLAGTGTRGATTTHSSNQVIDALNTSTTVSNALTDGRRLSARAGLRTEVDEST